MVTRTAGCPRPARRARPRPLGFRARTGPACLGSTRPVGPWSLRDKLAGTGEFLGQIGAPGLTRAPKGGGGGDPKARAWTPALLSGQGQRGGGRVSHQARRRDRGAEGGGPP